MHLANPCETLPTIPVQSNTLANNCPPRLDTPRARRLRSGDADPCAHLLVYLKANRNTCSNAFINPNTGAHPYGNRYFHSYGNRHSNPDSNCYSHPYGYRHTNPHGYRHSNPHARTDLCA